MPLCVALVGDSLAPANRCKPDPDPSLGQCASCLDDASIVIGEEEPPHPWGWRGAAGPGIPSFQGAVATLRFSSFEISVLRARAPSVPATVVSTQFFSDETSVLSALR